MKLKYVVSKHEQFKTVKEVLKAHFLMSDRLLLKLKKNQLIFKNKKAVFVNERIEENDILEINLEYEEDNSNIVPMEMKLSILYEDDAYLVINKPAGIPVHPSMNHYADSLSNGVSYYFQQIGLNKKIRPVNRLDKDTSGIVIFAKNEYIQECLIKQMKQNLFIKKYVAIVEGNLQEKTGTIHLPIARKENSIIERCISTDGDIAITHYQVLSSHPCYDVVQCILETGRTHQIRVHLSSVGHSIIGDTLYGTASSFINRQALHAIEVQFVHPISKQLVNYIAELPEDLKELI